MVLMAYKYDQIYLLILLAYSILLTSNFDRLYVLRASNFELQASNFKRHTYFLALIEHPTAFVRFGSGFSPAIRASMASAK